MVVELSAYYHQRYEFESLSGEVYSTQHLCDNILLLSTPEGTVLLLCCLVWYGA